MILGFKHSMTLPCGELFFSPQYFSFIWFYAFPVVFILLLFVFVIRKPMQHYQHTHDALKKQLVIGALVTTADGKTGRVTALFGHVVIFVTPDGITHETLSEAITGVTEE